MKIILRSYVNQKKKKLINASNSYICKKKLILNYVNGLINIMFNILLYAQYEYISAFNQ